MSRLAPHQVLLAAAVAVCVGSGIWFGVLAPAGGAGNRGKKPDAPKPLSVYQAVAQDAPAVRTETWATPPAQRRGAEWIYDVFTPPEIFYDERTKQFSITPPQLEEETEAISPPAPFGVTLVSVTRPLFRLQLIGFVGGEGRYSGLFENTETTETILASSGRRLPALGLTIERLTVTREPVSLPDAMTTRQLVATAVVRDDRTGELVTLTNRERLAAGAPVAKLKLETSEVLHDVRAGEQLEAGEIVFHIDHIELEPAAVTVTRHGADRPDEQQTLTLTGPPPAAP